MICRFKDFGGWSNNTTGLLYDRCSFLRETSDLTSVSWYRCASSILGDEMGLGKTLQIISFFAFLKSVRYQPPCASLLYLSFTTRTRVFSFEYPLFFHVGFILPRSLFFASLKV